MSKSIERRPGSEAQPCVIRLIPTIPLRERQQALRWLSGGYRQIRLPKRKKYPVLFVYSRLSIHVWPQVLNLRMEFWTAICELTSSSAAPPGGASPVVVVLPLSLIQSSQEGPAVGKSQSAGRDSSFSGLPFD